MPASYMWVYVDHGAVKIRVIRLNASLALRMKKHTIWLTAQIHRTLYARMYLVFQTDSLLRLWFLSALVECDVSLVKYDTFREK